MSYKLLNAQGKTALIIETGFRSPVTDATMTAIKAALLSHPELDKGRTAEVPVFAELLSTLRKVTFVEFRDNPHLVAFSEFYNALFQRVAIADEGGYIMQLNVKHQGVILDLYETFNRLVSNAVFMEWWNAHQAAQVLFPASDLVKPESLLTTEQLEDTDFLGHESPAESVSGNGRESKRTTRRAQKT